MTDERVRSFLRTRADETREWDRRDFGRIEDPKEVAAGSPPPFGRRLLATGQTTVVDRGLTLRRGDGWERCVGSRWVCLLERGQ